MPDLDSSSQSLRPRLPELLSAIVLCRWPLIPEVRELIVPRWGAPPIPLGTRNYGDLCGFSHPSVLGRGSQESALFLCPTLDAPRRLWFEIGRAVADEAGAVAWWDAKVVEVRVDADPGCDPFWSFRRRSLIGITSPPPSSLCSSRGPAIMPMLFTSSSTATRPQRQTVVRVLSCQVPLVPASSSTSSSFLGSFLPPV